MRSVIDEDGHRLNYYEYDPFGKITQIDETVHNIFQYLGSLGIVKHDELIDMYYMRDRVYDASHGRFVSVDPLGKLRSPIFNYPFKVLSTPTGFIGRSTNFYVYAQNSPMNVKDPSGKILPLAPLVASLLVRSALGAVESIVFDVAFSLAEGKLPTINGNMVAIKHLMK